MAYDTRNRGTLSKNDRKQPGSRQPDYRGRLDVNGEAFELSGWIAEGKSGKFISLSIQPAGAWRNRDHGAQHHDDADIDRAMPSRDDDDRY